MSSGSGEVGCAVLSNARIAVPDRWLKPRPSRRVQRHVSTRKVRRVNSILGQTKISLTQGHTHGFNITKGTKSVPNPPPPKHTHDTPTILLGACLYRPVHTQIYVHALSSCSCRRIITFSGCTVMARK